MFLREHFEAIAPIPVEYSVMVADGTGLISSTKSIYRARAFAVGPCEQSAGNSLDAVRDIEENFNFRPYIYDPTRIHRVQLFEETSLGLTLVPRSLAPMKAVDGKMVKKVIYRIK